ncbi:hypothetical protein E2562_002440 [Oryza meyeriana var. granulata]|uniref:Uncharacterized protein n=1 Tax=Oryza meyeriana var. granulata TaxID=110450 RepID=A0A6G1F2G8_9ORYZ|nr:hypothetical protein E2562_002440 [Oryza meyeriana var. granulata]
MVCPIGIKRAKKGKGTADEVTLEVREHLQTLMQTQATQKEELEGIKDHQQKLSDQRVETATLQLKAAQEKEAKCGGQVCKAHNGLLCTCITFVECCPLSCLVLDQEALIPSQVVTDQ